MMFTSMDRAVAISVTPCHSVTAVEHTFAAEVLHTHAQHQYHAAARGVGCKGKGGGKQVSGGSSAPHVAFTHACFATHDVMQDIQSGLG